MSKLTLFLLGPPRIELEGVPVEIGRRKALALLSYLVVSGERQPRETLATLLWPESSWRRARKSLRRDLSELNLALEGAWLEADRTSVGLRAGCWLDVARFQHHLAHNRTDPQTLKAAVALYRDDFLTGFSLPDCPEFDEWQLFQTEGLRQELASALEKLVAALGNRSDYETAIPYARRRLALDPLHEAAHRQLMRLYAQTGQQAAALRQYDLCRQTLADELGISPAVETTGLYDDIRTGKTTFASPIASAALLPSSFVSPGHNLPIQTTTFIGRQAELADIERLLLAEPGCRLLTLVGPGGVGKTRLALTAAGQILNAFPDGAYFVSLASIEEAADIIPAVAVALRFIVYGQADPKDQLLNYLHQKKLLLVVDNFEHLLERATLLSEVLRHARQVSLLVTSRERLNLQEEWLYQVSGLPFPDLASRQAGGLDDGSRPEPISRLQSPSSNFQDYSAIELFTQRARQIEAGFTPSAAELVDIGRICQLVEGMPLGLELAASWIRTLSCREIAAEIEGSLDFLSTSLRNMPKRHRSLPAVFEQSWERLSTAEQTILAKLSVFRGGFGRTAAVEVGEATAPLLMGLVDKSLLSRSAMGSYELHALVRQFAKEKLSATPGNDEQTRLQYCRYYAALLAGYEREHKNNLASTAASLANIQSDWRNIQAAWHQALAYPLISEIGQFAYFLSMSYEFRGLIQEGEETFGLALARLRDRAESVSPIMLLRVLTHYGFFCMSFSKLEQAGQLLEEALALSAMLDDETHLADIGLMLHFLVWVARLQEQPARAREFQQQSMETCQKAGYQMGQWMGTVMKGELEGDVGNHETACQYYQQALSLAENTWFVPGTIHALVFLGNAHAALADQTRAVDYLRRGLSLNRDLLLIAPLFTGLLALVTLFDQRGQPALAFELLIIIRSHPQCDIVAQHKARAMVSELQTRFSDDQVTAVEAKVKRGQFSLPYLEPNFRIDVGFVDRLLALIDQVSRPVRKSS